MIGYDRLTTGADHMTKAYKYRVWPCNRYFIERLQADDITFLRLHSTSTSHQDGW